MDRRSPFSCDSRSRSRSMAVASSSTCVPRGASVRLGAVQGGVGVGQGLRQQCDHAVGAEGSLQAHYRTPGEGVRGAGPPTPGTGQEGKGVGEEHWHGPAARVAGGWGSSAAGGAAVCRRHYLGGGGWCYQVGRGCRGLFWARHTLLYRLKNPDRYSHSSTAPPSRPPADVERDLTSSAAPDAAFSSSATDDSGVAGGGADIPPRSLSVSSCPFPLVRLRTRPLPLPLELVHPCRLPSTVTSLHPTFSLSVSSLRVTSASLRIRSALSSFSRRALMLACELIVSCSSRRPSTSRKRFIRALSSFGQGGWDGGNGERVSWGVGRVAGGVEVGVEGGWG
eukprot:scaffold18781_cov103-Isochrysis_galbana.AAC.1